MSPECAIIVGAILGALITVFASYGVESFREVQRNKRRRQSAARTIASEVYANTEAVEELFNRTDITLRTVREKFADFQWQQYKKEIWDLDPKLGILFQNYYKELENMKYREFNHESDLRNEFTPLIELAKKCLREADFPMRKGGATVSVVISTELNPESKSEKD